MRQKPLPYQPVFDDGCFYPETWSGMEALVKSAFYASTRDQATKVPPSDTPRPDEEEG